MLIIISLILLGIVLMLIEMLLTPGVGIAGVLSLVSLGGSCYYAFDKVDRPTGLIVTSIVIVILVLMTIWILRAKTWKKFELGTVIDAKVNQEGDLVNVGEQGTASTRLSPMGQVRFSSISCEVRSEDNSMVDPGTKVEVTRIENKKIFVKPVND